MIIQRIIITTPTIRLNFFLLKITNKLLTNLAFLNDEGRHGRIQCGRGFAAKIYF